MILVMHMSQTEWIADEVGRAYEGEPKQEARLRLLVRRR